MSWKMSWKKWVYPVALGIGVWGGLILMRGSPSFPPLASERVVKVDTAKMIRQASEQLAQEMTGNREGAYPGVRPDLLAKKVEAYKDRLVDSLNAFGNKNRVIVLASNQVFGDVFDVTEDFVAFREEENRS